MNRQTGFTLVELLIGLSLLALIVAALSGSLRLGLAGQERVVAGAERLEELRLSHALLRKQITQARPVSWIGDRNTVAAFDGDQSAVSFLGVFPNSQLDLSLHQIAIRLNGQDLVIERRPTSGEEQFFRFGENTARDVILSGVKAITISYYGVQGEQTAPSWHSRWNGQPGLPQLVRISAQFNDTSRTPWPDLVVAPKIGPQPR